MKKSKPSRQQNKSPFLTPKEAADYLRVSIRLLEYYRSHGGGPRYRKHGNCVRYPRNYLDKWSKEREYKHTGGADR